MPENRIQGHVLCRRRDAYGEIVVAEEGCTRTLYFGNGIAQSAIRTDRPELLLEDYNEAMMCGLLFNSKPRSILLVGLGGGSLVHFLLKALPECMLHVVEIRQEVIEVARQFFFLPLPQDDPRLRIFHGSGTDLIRSRREGAAHYDIIIVDAFDENGPACAILERDFLAACRERLAGNGVFIINLWNSPEHRFSDLYVPVQCAFKGSSLKLLLSESYRNAVAIGSNGPAVFRDLPRYRALAADLQQRYDINFPKYLKHLYWQNFDGLDQ